MFKLSQGLRQALASESQDIVFDLYGYDPVAAGDRMVMAEVCLDRINSRVHGEMVNFEVEDLMEKYGYDALLAEAAKFVSIY